MRMILESQLPTKIRNPTTEKEKGWNLCLAEIKRIIDNEAIYELKVRRTNHEQGKYYSKREC